MTLTERIKKWSKRLLKEYSEVAGDVYKFVRQCLGAKKVLIISEKNISSIPISSKSQAMTMLAIMSFMLWVSYSTGKYFAYEDIILEKDREIWTTNVTNENLQYQVADLHQNLKELNKYFENIRKYDQVADKPLFKGQVSEEAEDESVEQSKNLKDDEHASNDVENGAQKILYNIRGKVIERIDSLEGVINMTGIRLEDVANKNSALKSARQVISKDAGDAASNQGGPYEPIDTVDAVFNKDDFDSEVTYLTHLENMIHSMPLSSPMNQYRLSSRYGVRTDPIKKRLAMHSGLDLVGPVKAKIFSTAPGRVVQAGSYGAYGRTIEVDHGSGITTRYGHLQKIFVREGDEIKRNQLIALQGNTGRSTGSHLHYEVRFNGKPYNPEKFLKAGQYVF